MTSAQAPERAFAVFQRGQLRDEMLASFRVGLRQIINDETGLPFSEVEIATATARLSSWWIEAEGLDLVLLASGQARGLYLADQVRIDRAGTAFLEGYHLPMWGERKLVAAGGSGPVSSPCAPGTAWNGSTVIPDPAAVYGTAPDGKRYQVLFTALGVGGSVALTLAGVDTGTETNLAPGTTIKWANAPLGAQGDGTVTAVFTGGSPEESDADVAKRLLSRIRHKPASGNNAHFRSWCRDASSAVEDACVYACAFHAGSTLIAILQKRSTVLGPSARIASFSTLLSVTGYVVPPGSPVAPVPPHVLVLPAAAVASDMVISLAVPKGKSSGWADLQPWPLQSGGSPAFISSVTSQTHFTMFAATGLPSGVTAPSLMVWDDTQSRFTKLLVSSVSDLGGGFFDVVLSAPPGAPEVNTAAGQVSVPTVLAGGQYISPFAARARLVGETIDAFFDSLGPGEIVDLASDLRAHRAFRFPQPAEELPQRAGSSVLTYMRDALGAALADSNLESVSVTFPAVPSDPVFGPALIVAGRVGIYPLN